MSRAQKREAQPWLRYLVLPFILILFGLVVSYALLAQQERTPRPQPIQPTVPTPTPTPTPTPCTLDENPCSPISCSYDPKKCQSSYICPPNGWVNCMPILSPEGQKNCSSAALTWYRQNCPGFQGAAY